MFIHHLFSNSNQARKSAVCRFKSTTPETYVGYDIARAPLGNPEGFKPDHTVWYDLTESSPPGGAIFLQLDIINGLPCKSR